MPGGERQGKKVGFRRPEEQALDVVRNRITESECPVSPTSVSDFSLQVDTTWFGRRLKVKVELTEIDSLTPIAE